MTQVNDWSGFIRDDLKMIPTMEANGFTVTFHDQDRLHKRTTPENVPNHEVGFKKGTLNIWKIIDRSRDIMVWQTADLIDGYYRNHTPYDTLEEIIALTAIKA